MIHESEASLASFGYHDETILNVTKILKKQYKYVTAVFHFIDR
jgi:hypothetical protein